MLSNITVGRKYLWGKSTFTTVKHEYTGEFVEPAIPIEYEAQEIEVPDDVRLQLSENNTEN